MKLVDARMPSRRRRGATAWLRLAPVALVASLLLVPTSAGASGPTSLACAGNSSSAAVGYASSDVLCETLPHTDDDGAYHFDYVPPLWCNNPFPFNFFTVIPQGPEIGAPGFVGTYSSNGTTIDATFQYTAIDPPSGSASSIETHHFHLKILCRDGTTTGTFSE